MKATLDLTDSPASTQPDTIKVVIVYEDLSTGMRGKRFAEALAGALDCGCRFQESIWRSEILEFAPIAEEASRDAADSDYIVISLRGNTDLSHATRCWLETQLDGAAERGAGLVVLFDSAHSQRRTVESARQYFRCVSEERGVAFFSYSTVESAGSEEPGLTFHEVNERPEPARSIARRRRMPALLAA